MLQLHANQEENRRIFVSIFWIEM